MREEEKGRKVEIWHGSKYTAREVLKKERIRRKERGGQN